MANMHPAAIIARSVAFAALFTAARAHVAAFTKGMYCLNGTTGNNLNSDDPVLPLYQLRFDQWWCSCPLFTPSS
ncbi:hypothetical protein D9757_011067 [Collybiopsis confluens]|uniref:Secreted protein n=1 Tax=Collybiopsis confluens TaxID=2823264 RepID=A0A8H5LTN0_9AGAR|nr:hypothetical protein D9757_011067 [Collybiopsis confluens]